MTDETNPPAARPMSEAARRALAEAEARRAEIDAATRRPREILGRSGPEPVRYGDWENKGIASDF
jgi:hypothetical protein